MQLAKFQSQQEQKKKPTPPQSTGPRIAKQKQATTDESDEEITAHLGGAEPLSNFGEKHLGWES